MRTPHSQSLISSARCSHCDFLKIDSKSAYGIGGHYSNGVTR